MKVKYVEAEEHQRKNADKFQEQTFNMFVGDKVLLLRNNLKTCNWKQQI